ncbi:hypothetical protein TMPK1_31780 [Rhodospirillales bacterium TMPK1]|uniref:Uncharacterized protein n=1 Tax=Roseiterribacter gracilis TaxID=2812848 RepID=A0A8S8XG49_9PROT|nr:hypothetical protein TMPK1_31780 [Rhodospirillales bacterium TMPK1]
MLALCQCWRAYRSEEERISALWSQQETALRRASDAERGEAELAFNLVDRAQVEAMRNSETYFNAMFQVPAATIEGAIAKLEATLVQFEPGPSIEEEPWPQLRSVLSDMRRLTPHLAVAT